MSIGRTQITDYRLWWSRKERKDLWICRLTMFFSFLVWIQRNSYLISTHSPELFSPSLLGLTIFCTEPPLQTQPKYHWFPVRQYLYNLCSPYKVFILQAVSLLWAAGQLSGRSLCPSACWEAWTVRWSPAKAGLREALGSGGKCGARVWIPYTWQS